MRVKGCEEVDDVSFEQYLHMKDLCMRKKKSRLCKEKVTELEMHFDSFILSKRLQNVLLVDNKVHVKSLFCAMCTFIGHRWVRQGKTMVILL